MAGFLPGLLFFAGILLTLWMQIFTRNGVVFSGDGGLKALLAQDLAHQLSTGSFPLDMALALPTNEWITTVWQQGLYPFTPPFVYEVGPQHFITFPFTFPLISAPFYALFGNPGLYIVPLVALWLIWIRFWQIGHRAGWGLGTLCLGLVSLIFASPLSLYGGMYWEHTLAVALAFWGVSALAFPKAAVLSRYQVLGSGILIGLAVWFRPEFLCLVAAVSGLALIGWLRPRWQLAPPLTLAKTIILVGAMICTVGVFFALNYGTHGHPFGIHTIQTVGESTLFSQIEQAKDGYGQMFSSLVRYFPVVILVSFVAVVSPELKKLNLKKSRLKNTPLRMGNRLGGRQNANARRMNLIRRQVQFNPTSGRFAIALSLLFALSVPLIVPPDAGGTQWGPRFYLILVPLLSWVLAEQLRAEFFDSWVRRLGLLGTAIALVLGIQLNTLNGAFNAFSADQSVSLLENYTSIAPAIAQLRTQPLPWIAISHQFVAQQLWLALPEKTFFRTENITDVKQLATALVAQGESEFLYVCYPHQDCPTPETAVSDLGLDNGQTLTFEALGLYGKYPTYKVEISS